jgi:hypothetical protein
VQASADLLECYEAMGNFLDSIIIGDDTWVHQFRVEAKWHSVEWWLKDSSRRKKFKALPCAGRIMYSAFCGKREVILMDFLEWGGHDCFC